MNCINKVKELPEGLTTQELCVYFYLLSRCYQEDDLIISHVSTDSLKRQFALDDEQLEMLLDSLYSNELISEEDGIVEVGYVSDKIVILYTSEEVSETAGNFFTNLLELADDFISTAKRAVSRSLAQEIYEDLLTISKVKPTEITTPQLLTLFKRVVELYLQEEYRAFDKSEAGSMKRLLTNLGGVKMIGLIITYIQNFEKWGEYPNILNMTKNKDAVYGTVKSVEVKGKRDGESFG
jgi:hypothetical protein